MPVTAGRSFVRNKYHRGLMIFFGVVLVVILLIKLVAEPYIIKRIKSELRQQNSEFSLYIQKIDIRWIPPGIALHGITFRNGSKTDEDSISGQIQSAVLQGINPLKLFFGNYLSVKRLSLDKGNINISMTGSSEAPQPIIAKSRVSIDRIEMNGIALKYSDRKSNRSMHFSDIRLQIERMNLNKLDTFSSSKIKFFELAAGRLAFYSKDSLYSCMVYGLSYSDISGTARIDSLNIIPRYNQYTFANFFEFQTDRIEAKTEGIVIDNLSLNKLLDKGDIIANHITFQSVQIFAFRDKRKKFLHSPRKMLQDILYGFPGLIKVDSLTLNNGSVTYSEHAENAAEAGYVSFNGLSASIINLTNDTLYRRKEGYLSITASALLMNRGKITLGYNARLYDAKRTFSMKGKMEGLDLAVLNSYYKASESINLSGNTNSLNFEFTADSLEARGHLTFFYQNLRIEVENKKGFLRDKLTTWFANLTLIDSNPLPGKEVRTGIISYRRDPERFLFNYFVKSLLSGIQSTVTKD